MFGVRALMLRVTWGIVVGKITSLMCTTLMFTVTHPSNVYGDTPLCTGTFGDAPRND